MNLILKQTTSRINCEIKKAFERFEKHSVKENYGFPAYWYHEQRTKTFITIALDRISKGNVIQEPGLDRKYTAKAGRADYFVCINKTKYLIEVKQIWTQISRLSRPDDFNRITLNKIISQIKDIKNSRIKHDVCLGLCIVPIFEKIEGKPLPKERNISNLIKSVSESIIKHKNIISIEYVDSKLFRQMRVPTDYGDEFYYGYFLIWLTDRQYKDSIR